MMMRLCVLAVALLLALMPASAQDVSRQESRKAKLQREIELLDQQLEQNASKSSAMLSSLEPSSLVTCSFLARKPSITSVRPQNV